MDIDLSPKAKQQLEDTGSTYAYIHITDCGIRADVIGLQMINGRPCVYMADEITPEQMTEHLKSVGLTSQPIMPETY